VTLGTLVAASLAGVLGAAVASVVVRPRLAGPPEALIRTNFRGRRVPAVLGEAVAFGGLVALGVMSLLRAAGWDDPPRALVALAFAAVTVVMGAAGSWDDHRGDERPRGYRGHLSALRSGRLTGGLIKLLAGGLVGLLAGWLISEDPLATIEIGLLVALSANLSNLLDRAPGRAAKVWLVALACLLPVASSGWIVAAGGLLGALLVVLPFDLSERGMLGDAGANPLGGALGLGLATALGGAGRWIAILVLAALNVLSERYSFSEIISRTPWLKKLDDLGRSRN
jgi:hypothetical protein